MLNVRVQKLMEEKEEARNDGYDDGYTQGVGHTKHFAIQRVTESIDAAKEFRNKCTEEGNQVGITNANSGILSFSTIKIKLMEEL